VIINREFWWVQIDLLMGNVIGSLISSYSLPVESEFISFISRYINHLIIKTSPQPLFELAKRSTEGGVRLNGNYK